MDPKDILDAMRTANSAFEAGMRAERENGEAARRLKQLIADTERIVSWLSDRPRDLDLDLEIVINMLRAALSHDPYVGGWISREQAEKILMAPMSPPCADPLTPEQRAEYEEDKRTDTLTHGRVDREGWE